MHHLVQWSLHPGTGAFPVPDLKLRNSSGMRVRAVWTVVLTENCGESCLLLARRLWFPFTEHSGAYLWPGRLRARKGADTATKPPVCGAKGDLVVGREDPSAQAPTPVTGGVWSHQLVAQQRGGPRGGNIIARQTTFSLLF